MEIKCGENFSELLDDIARYGSGWGTEGSGVVPCEDMNCPPGSVCELGTIICPFEPPCFTFPTRCVPYQAPCGISFMFKGGEFSGSGEEEGSGSGSGECPVGLESAKCGNVCFEDCEIVSFRLMN
ncbi:unnamed protein product [Strongylus vulgaris]|uniref:Uncharacterized protein n=1 Tax=Strongylus vulgaris TaxID=40348 RepID=A0A3P7IGH0_STRVU|nr:unnamed protein product [Strongylus vulgaris]